MNLKKIPCLFFIISLSFFFRCKENTSPSFSFDVELNDSKLKYWLGGSPSPTDNQYVLQVDCPEVIKFAIVNSERVDSLTFFIDGFQMKNFELADNSFLYHFDEVGLHEVDICIRKTCRKSYLNCIIEAELATKIESDKPERMIQSKIIKPIIKKSKLEASKDSKEATSIDVKTRENSIHILKSSKNITPQKTLNESLTNTEATNSEKVSQPENDAENSLPFEEELETNEIKASIKESKKEKDQEYKVQVLMLIMPDYRGYLTYLKDLKEILLRIEDDTKNIEAYLRHYNDWTIKYNIQFKSLQSKRDPAYGILSRHLGNKSITDQFEKLNQIIFTNTHEILLKKEFEEELLDLLFPKSGRWKTKKLKSAINSYDLKIDGLISILEKEIQLFEENLKF